mmetsp:Transcript_14921/g.46725  ORF Transcript_14921/g.46725 Transcript_14921/m.46725 type:complete len:212 (-) Transcript_14921:791-1426(-)
MEPFRRHAVPGVSARDRGPGAPVRGRPVALLDQLAHRPDHERGRAGLRAGPGRAPPRDHRPCRGAEGPGRPPAPALPEAALLHGGRRPAALPGGHRDGLPHGDRPAPRGQHALGEGHVLRRQLGLCGRPESSWRSDLAGHGGLRAGLRRPGHESAGCHRADPPHAGCGPAVLELRRQPPGVRCRLGDDDSRAQPLDALRRRRQVASRSDAH